jgi:hypothetical protein
MREQYPYYNNYGAQVPSYERDDYYMKYCNEAQEPTGSCQSNEPIVDNRRAVYTGQAQEQPYFDYSQYGHPNGYRIDYPMEHGQNSLGYVFLDSVEKEKEKENNRNGLLGNNFANDHTS